MSTHTKTDTTSASPRQASKDGKRRKGSSATAVELTMENGRMVKIRGITAEQLRAAVGGSMTLEEASKYISDNNDSGDNNMSSSPTSKSGRVSFGPERPPSKSKNNNNNNAIPSSAASSPSMDYASMAAAMAAMGAGSTARSTTFNLGDLDAAWKKSSSNNNNSANNKSSERRSNSSNPNGMPCTEEEMKALMGMFMEIMGMSMSSTSTSPNSNKNKEESPSSACTSKAGPYFSFGDGGDANMPDGMSAAAAAAAAFFPDGSSWEALRRTYAAAEQVAKGGDQNDGDNDENNDRELTFEEVEYLLQQRKQKEASALKLDNEYSSGDWESLEQVSIDDQTQNDDDDSKERKVAKKREKKNRRKAKHKEEAAQKAAEMEQKKREKATLSWRSRVISATQSNDTIKLEALLKESPLRKLDERESSMHLSNAGVTAHFEFLLPNTIPKNRANTERGAEARLRLARFVLDYDVRLAFEPLRTGRTAFHTACFYGDLQFVDLVLQLVEAYEKEKGKVLIPNEYFDTPCLESGWTPLHYAAISCSSDIVERLLLRGCDSSATTDPTHTWKKADGKGLSSRELVELVKNGKHGKNLETHGIALQEITNTYFSHHQDRREFVKKLDRISFRLSGIEKNGYTPPPTEKVDPPQRADAKVSEVDVAENSSSRNKKKKKKKNQGGKGTESPSTTKTEEVPEKDEEIAPEKPKKAVEEETDDPLVQALLGMGFERTQILSAIEACGGIHRATADDVVMKILGQSIETNPDEDVVSGGEEQSPTPLKTEKDFLVESGMNAVPSKQSSTAKEQEAARKLAQKREEARRRNREWNMREQARQKQEVSEKVVKKAVQHISVAVPKVVPPSVNPTLPRATTQMAAGFQAAPRYASARPAAIPPQPERYTTEANKIAQRQQSSIPSRGPQIYPKSIPENAHVSSPPPGPPASVSVASSNHQVPSMVYEDDRTVSSFGSNRGLSVNSREFVPANFSATPPVLSTQTPPPGFMPVTAQPVPLPVRPHPSIMPRNTAEPSSHLQTDVQNGEIRATAKAFVPSTFAHNNLILPNRPVHDASQAQTLRTFSGGYGVGPSLLSRPSVPVGPPSSVGQSFLTSFEPVPTMTPVSEDSTIPGSSLLSGLSLEDSALPIPATFGGNGSKLNSGFLDPAPVMGSLGVTSIWGDTGSQAIPPVGDMLTSTLFGEDKETLSSGKPSLWDMDRQKMTQGSIW
jgi:Ankyrin repeats (3 copies)